LNGLIVQHLIYTKAAIACIAEVQGIYFTRLQVGNIKIADIFPGGRAI
jgi:hypothetical protein